MKPTTLSAGLGVLAALCGAQALITRPAHAAWEPTRPVEIIVPAGTGGGADQMARTVQGIIAKHNLMKQSMVVINKAGGAGGEGFLDVKAS
ncbi:MAG TPA: tripartite tricarboxylate transporter substrate binding protein, partial [Bacillota bacterium]